MKIYNKILCTLIMAALASCSYAFTVINYITRPKNAQASDFTGSYIGILAGSHYYNDYIPFAKSESQPSITHYENGTFDHAQPFYNGPGGWKVINNLCGCYSTHGSYTVDNTSEIILRGTNVSSSYDAATIANFSCNIQSPASTSKK